MDTKIKEIVKLFKFKKEYCFFLFYSVDFTTSSPSGLTKTQVQKATNEDINILEPLTNGSFWYYTEITWTPKYSQLGSNIFCFTAVAKSQ